MSILIEGMSKKEFAELLGLYKILPPEVIDEMKTLEGHKVIEIPPHGRLIDADALMREFGKEEKAMEIHGQEFSSSFLSSFQEISTEWYCVEDILDNAPTIIEAEVKE